MSLEQLELAGIIAISPNSAPLLINAGWHARALGQFSRRQRIPENMRRVFRSLRSFNYRIWAAGALVSNIGTWMQRAAQDWLVLTQLTNHSASAVGIVMAFQFGPQLLMMP